MPMIGHLTRRTIAMKKEHKGSTRRAAALPEDLNKRLAVYALAAGAAGVGVLALAMPAEATIIGSSENIVVDLSHPNETLAITGGPTLNFHLNDREPGANSYFISLQGAGIGIPSPRTGLEMALPIPRGALFGPNQFSIQFGPRSRSVTHSFLWGSEVNLAGFQGIDGYGHSFRTLVSRHPGYLGFEWNGHVGWLALDMPGSGFAVQVTEYAYDTVPGQSITVGAAAASEPSTPTLVLLALGALGLAALRKRRRSEASSQQPDAVSR
jgi:MYXO-CTERM domain-containing protein